MRVSPIATCLWPGLPRIWYRGEWRALAAAVLFGAALDLLLVSTFVWPELFPVSWVTFGWFALAAVWIVATVQALRSFSSIRETVVAGDQGLFNRARAEYLRGRWSEAESLLTQIVGRCKRDIEAQLMLATLYRRTRRFDEAHDRLRTLERLDGADRWSWEIDQERKMLKRLASANGEQQQPTAAVGKKED